MIPSNVLELMRKVGLFPVVLATSDREGKPHITFITWVYPFDEKTIRLAVSSNSRSARNMLETRKASLMLFAQDTALACYGEATLLKENIEELKFPVSVFQINLSGVENNLFPGGTVTGAIPFMHTGDWEKAGELNMIVLDALKA